VGEGVHLQGKISMVVSGLGYRKVLVSTGWAITLFCCTNWLKTAFAPRFVGPLFLAMKLLLNLDGL